MSTRNHSAISKSSVLNSIGPRCRPTTGVSQRPETTVEKGESTPRTSTLSGLDSQLLIAPRAARSPRRRRRSVSAPPPGNAIWPGCWRSSSERSTKSRGTPGVAGSHRSSTDAGRRPSRRRRHDLAGSRTASRSRSTIGARSSSAGVQAACALDRPYACSDEQSTPPRDQAAPALREMRRRAALLASRVRGQGHVGRGAALCRLR